MPDIYNKKKRSEIMSQISNKDTNIEELVRRQLFSKGFRYRKNVNDLPGKPDILLPKYNVAIFVHGCFWHGHASCLKSKLPVTRTDFWKNKLNDNKLRDKRDLDRLINSGWRVAVVWECVLKKKDSIDMAISKLEGWILSDEKYCEIPLRDRRIGHISNY